MKYNLILSLILSISSISIVLIVNRYSIKSHLHSTQFEKNVNKNKKPQELRSNNKLKIEWDVFDDWEEVRGNDFALASYKIDNVKTNSEISITKFPGDAGGIENNVNRWRRQLELPLESIESIAEKAELGNNKLGNFSIYKIVNNDKPGMAFLCMIQSLNESTIFVKLKSSKNGIDRLESMFYDFCFSFRFKE